MTSERDTSPHGNIVVVVVDVVVDVVVVVIKVTPVITVLTESLMYITYPPVGSGSPELMFRVIHWYTQELLATVALAHGIVTTLPQDSAEKERTEPSGLDEFPVKLIVSPARYKKGEQIDKFALPQQAKEVTGTVVSP